MCFLFADVMSTGEVLALIEGASADPARSAA
jgi:hypothetical protein